MILIGFIILFLILLFIYKKGIIKNKYLKDLCKYFLFSLAISSLLELTIFNYRFYESLLYSNKSEEITDYTYIDGISCNKEECTIKKDTSYIEITDINKKVNNIELNLNSNRKLITSFKIYFGDSSNSSYFTAGSREYSKYVPVSHFFRLHSNGKVKKIRLQVTDTNAKFTIDSIKINSRVPFFVSEFRLILVLAVCFFIMVINPTNKLQELKYNFKNSKTITISIILLMSFIFSLSTFMNKQLYDEKPEQSHLYQYNLLAESLAKGYFYLDKEVSSKLLDLSNPYDISKRNEKLEGDVDYCWDCSYYKGKYYVYFGIVPCLLTYLPYHLITHKALPNNIAMSIFIFIYIICCFYLVYQIINKYFKKTSYPWYLLISIFFVFASGVMSFASYPQIYNMPVITGVSFACLGLAFWLKSTNDKKLNKKYLFLGSLCMALVAGCRPQLLLSSFFAIIIFWDYVFKKRELFSKDSLKETILFMLPYILVASFLFYYNFTRFGSIFDFGANYNLTTNDMTKRGFKLDRIFLGLYYFLFAPVKITPIFPFIEVTEVATTYIGKTISENNFGGLLFINLISILGFLSFKFKKVITDKKLFKISVISVIFTLIIIIADTEMAGILPRYLYDFAWLINLSTIIVILSLLDKNILNKDFKKLIITFIIISLIYNSLSFFTDRYIFTEYNTLRTIYSYIYHSFMFWL